MRVSEMACDRDKLAELIVHIAKECRESETFGSTVLNKILYEADFRHYAQYGRSITHDVYQHLRWGPAPLSLLPVRNELLESGDIELNTKDYHGKPQKRVIPKREANLSIFTDLELEDVGWAIKEVSCLTAKSASKRAHDAPWDLTEEGEPIPVYTTYLRFASQIPEEALALVREEASQKGLI